MDWSAFHLFLHRALSHAGRQSGQASHADNCSSALPGTSVRHRSHRGCHSAWHWEKCGRRIVSPRTETVWWLTTGYCLFQGFQSLPLSSESNDILSFCMKQTQSAFSILLSSAPGEKSCDCCCWWLATSHERQILLFPQTHPTPAEQYHWWDPRNKVKVGMAYFALCFIIQSNIIAYHILYVVRFGCSYFFRFLTMEMTP